MNTSNTPQPLHDAERPYAQFGTDDCEELWRTKARLDNARQELDERYEAFSECYLDSLVFAKARLDRARQKEKDCFEGFEQVYDRVVAVTSQHASAATDPGIFENEEDVSALGLIPKVSPRRIRAPNRASTRLAPQVARRNQDRDDLDSHRNSSRINDTRTRRGIKMLLRQSADRRAAARGSPKPLQYSRTLMDSLLGSRAGNDARFKAVLEAIAAGNADQDP